MDAIDASQAMTEEVVTGPGGSMRIRARAVTTDEWVYLYAESAAPRWFDYSWKVTFQCHTAFKELQFGFRYQDFYNRYRYRFQDGHLSFDVVTNGQFVADLSRVPCRIVLGRQYELEIRIIRNVFECWIDGVRISTDYDPSNRFPHGGVALILWEDDGHTDIAMDVERSTVTSLLPPVG